MNTDNARAVEVDCRLPPAHKARQYFEWVEANESFVKETIADLRQSMQAIAAYLRTYHAVACGHICLDLVVSWEPYFNAFLDRRQKTLTNLESGEQSVARPEVSIAIGVPAALACLKPVLSFCAREVAGEAERKPPTELLVMVARLHEAWHFQAYPPAMVTSLRQDPAWRASLTFILAHEVAHHVLLTESGSGDKYRGKARAVYQQLLAKPGFYNAGQIDQTRRLFENPLVRDKWTEELAADILAHEICRVAGEQEGLRNLMGQTTTCVAGAAFEHYLELEGIELDATHPYAVARLLAFEKHLQIELALTDAEFSTRPEWVFPIAFFQSVCRLLAQCGKSYYPSDLEWEGSFSDSQANERGGDPANDEQSDAPPEV